MMTQNSSFINQKVNIHKNKNNELIKFFMVNNIIIIEHIIIKYFLIFLFLLFLFITITFPIFQFLKSILLYYNKIKKTRYLSKLVLIRAELFT